MIELSVWAVGCDYACWLFMRKCVAFFRNERELRGFR